MSNVFHDLGVPIELNTPDDFLKIKETLERIGIASNKENKHVLFQSCLILHKRGEYGILHFKEMFKLDGRPSTIDASDIERRNLIVTLLEQWGLCKIINPETAKPTAHLGQIKIVPYVERETGKWEFKSKYSIGGHKH